MPYVLELSLHRPTLISALHSLVSLVENARTSSNATSNWDIPDPSLTTLGQEQARSIPLTYPKLFGNADVLLSSPLRRTVQTALAGFPDLAKGKVPLEIWPDLYVIARIHLATLSLSHC